MKNKILLLVMSLLILVGCSNKASEQSVPLDSKGTAGMNEAYEKTDGSEKKKITVTTTFIEDMVNELIGDNADVNLIIPAGEDPHVYVAKPDDYSKLNDADLVLYHGIHFEGKMVDALEKVGYAVTSTFDHSKIGQMEDEEDDSKMVEDPHFWFDLELYAEAFTNVADKLKDLYKDDPDFVAMIEKNHDDYLNKLKELDGYIKEEIKKIPEESRYLITPHDAFNYFARSYNIEVMAPQGVSTDSEVSNKDLEDTAQFIADHKIKAIFAESTTNPERMKKLQDIVSSKGFETKVVSGDGAELFSDSLSEKGEDADSFLKMYKHNIDLIVENLK